MNEELKRAKRIERLQQRIARINLCLARKNTAQMVEAFQKELKRREAELNYLMLL